LTSVTVLDIPAPFEELRAGGRRAGLELAEGFRRYKGHPYPQTALLEELLGSHVAVVASVAHVP
jgi:hypothetical protein